MHPSGFAGVNTGRWGTVLEGAHCARPSGDIFRSATSIRSFASCRRRSSASQVRNARLSGANEAMARLRDHQWYSVALSGTQWYSVVLSGTQWHSVVLSLRDHQWYSVLLSGNQWVYRSSGWSSVVRSSSNQWVQRRMGTAITRLIIASSAACARHVTNLAFCDDAKGDTADDWPN